MTPLVLLTLAAGLMGLPRVAVAAGIVLWDTGSRFGDTTQPDDRTAWKAVPSELFVFEADPLKAASDPGYYGREYSFTGDAVVENHSLTAVFWSAQGRVVIWSNSGAPSAGSPCPPRKIVEVAPLAPGAQPVKITHCEIVRNVGDAVVLEVFFSGGATTVMSAVFSFGRDEIVEIHPSDEVMGMRLLSPIEYGLVPGFVGDDLIFGRAEFAGPDALHLPAESVFVGLLQGEDSELVMTWPQGRQQLALRPAGAPGDESAFEAIDFNNDGQSLHLAVLRAPGIWHREELKPVYLEKDVALTWQRPFPARWKTQLSEAGVRTTFSLRESAGPIWRGVPGSYAYPAWFDGKTAVLHLSKKIPPKGESILYFLEGQDTPLGVLTPVDIMKATLGRPVCHSILDVAGRKLRTHHRRGDAGVHRACTCGCTEAIQALFEAGQEVANREEVKEALEDMNYFVQCHVERIDEYQRFAAGMLEFLRATANTTPELKPFCAILETTVQRIPEEYLVQKENMQSLAYAQELTRRTLALTTRRSSGNLAAYMELLNAWRAMGGAQDYVVAQCHTIARQLFQEAGYRGVTDPAAVVVARQVRAQCRQVLRNADGYEIWANY